MSKASEELLLGTTKQGRKQALLVLEDGSAYEGYSCGSDGEVFGEICFNTSMEGYLEVLTDPSYGGQIVVMTYPQIGNYGVDEHDVQRNVPSLKGFVARDICATPSNWRSKTNLPDFLRDAGVVGIEGIDTRALVRHIRENGAMRAGLSSVETDPASLLDKVRRSNPLVGENFVSKVCESVGECRAALPKSHDFALLSPEEARYRVVAYDCGMKESIMQGLIRSGCSVVSVSWNTPYQDVLNMEPDGVFLSNGPGDPDAVSETYSQVENLIGKVPIFGICLGHQMLGKAAGSTVEKLKYGHRGGNHPVMNLLTHRVEITAQNHGFGLVFPSLGKLIPKDCGGIAEHFDDLREWVKRNVAPVVENSRFGRIQLTHVNLNDGTIEGIRFLDVPAFSVQYHPEASPGPTDSHYLFSAFTRLMDNDPGYLNIDIANDRLSNWKFKEECESFA